MRYGTSYWTVKFRQLNMKYLILIKLKSLIIILKFLLFFLGGIYILRFLSPLLFKILISSLLKKAKESKTKEYKKRTKKTTSQSFGEYIDYEEVE